ncbi:hypothetical protein C8R43DRAFT_968302 [Mycena crocata]|nr:hypothetical protein C8R43DRAFT_968302 [Mycena crocata]
MEYLVPSLAANLRRDAIRRTRQKVARRKTIKFETSYLSYGLVRQQKQLIREEKPLPVIPYRRLIRWGVKEPTPMKGNLKSTGHHTLTRKTAIDPTPPSRRDIWWENITQQREETVRSQRASGESEDNTDGFGLRSKKKPTSVSWMSNPHYRSATTSGIRLESSGRRLYQGKKGKKQQGATGRYIVLPEKLVELAWQDPPYTEAFDDAALDVDTDTSDTVGLPWAGPAPKNEGQRFVASALVGFGRRRNGDGTHGSDSRKGISSYAGSGWRKTPENSSSRRTEEYGDLHGNEMKSPLKKKRFPRRPRADRPILQYTGFGLQRLDSGIVPPNKNKVDEELDRKAVSAVDPERILLTMRGWGLRPQTPKPWTSPKFYR